MSSHTKVVGGWRVRVLVHAPAAAAEPAVQAVVAELDRVSRVLSDTRSDSELSVLNRHAGEGPRRVSAELLALVARGRQVSADTGGAFALTAGGLTRLWPFAAPPGLRRPPAADELTAALAHVGDAAVEVDAAASTVALPRGARLELARLARGYGLERALAVLASHGLDDVLVSIDGALAARGTKGTGPWLVGIQDPRAAGAFAVLPAEGSAVATRGDYERFFESGGERFHDVLDPRSGRPAPGCRSATVIAADPIAADALASAVCVLGPDEGMQLVERTPAVEAVIVGADNGVLLSTGIRERLRMVRSPTP